MFVIIWTYIMKAGKQSEFEGVYNSEGTWAQLFRKAKGYLGTELLRDSEDPLRCVTIDRWKDESSFKRFKEEYYKEYDSLDTYCASLTESEQHIISSEAVS